MGSTDQSMTDIAKDSSSEQSGFLADEGDLATKPAQVKTGDILAVKVHSTTNWVVEALNKTNNGGLS